jgi:acetyltransferase-like isoleucine patch superfamily enzyme
VLHNVAVGSDALVAAGAVCTQGLVIPEFALAVGVPARIKENGADQATMAYSRESYQRLARRYPSELRRLV